MATPVATFHIYPLRADSAPTTPLPPRKQRLLLPREQEKNCIDQFNASWPVLPVKGEEVKFPHLKLSVQHTGTNGSTPSPLAMLAFQKAFQKMKSASSSPKVTPIHPLLPQISLEKKTSLATNAPLNPSTASVLERLQALAPDGARDRKAGRRRHNLQLSPNPSKQNASFSKTSSHARLMGMTAKGALIMGMPKSPSSNLLNQQMRRVRSSGSRGNLNSMLY
jgi:hypothetical protein